MSRLNEITSTEKLLNLIRGKDHKFIENAPNISSGPEHKRFSGFQSINVNKILPHHKTESFGIDIGVSHIKLIKATRISDNRWKLLDWKQIPIPFSLSKDSDEFAQFLKSEISLFCGTGKTVKIWGLISAENIEVRHIRIPKVPGKEIANAVYWTIKKEVPFDEKENFIDFEVQGEVIEQGINKIAIMAYLAPVREVEAIRRLFSNAEMPLTGITIIPFAIQNLFRNGWCDNYEDKFAILFIGNDFSRIDIYSRGNLVMTRDIKAGINSMIDSLIEGYNQKLMQKSSVPAGDLPEETTITDIQIDRADAQEMLFSLAPDFKGESESDKYKTVNKEEIFSMTIPAVERAVRQVERTFGYYSTLPGGEKIEKLYVSGVLSVYAPLIKYIEDQLGIKTEMLDVFKQQDFLLSGDKKIVSNADKIALVPALGAALSENKSTLNLIYTYKYKKKEADDKRINHNILISFAAAILICALIFGYQNYVIRKKETTLSSLQHRMVQTPYLNREMVKNVALSVKEQQEILKVYSSRYEGMAVLSELSGITPPEIRFQRLKISLGGFSPEGMPAEPTGEVNERIVIEGVIRGDISYAQAALSRYVLKLDSSPMFNQVGVKDSYYSESDKGAKGTSLYFTLNVKIG